MSKNDDEREMSKNDDELNEFIDEVTDGSYSLTCVEVIFKLVNHMHPLGDERIKKIVATLATEGIKISIASDILIYGLRIRMYAHTFYNTLFRIPTVYFGQVRTP